MPNIKQSKSNFSKLTKLFKTLLTPYIKHTTSLPLVRTVLPIETVTNIKTFLGAHVAKRANTHVHFDSDAVEIILDSGCSFTISFCRDDFISFRPSVGQVEGLGIHKIKGRGTVKYTVLDNNGDKINILIKDALYVPTLTTRLLSIQQLAQQSDDYLAGAHILGDALHLRWDHHEKVIPYHSASNLPILFTVPGGEIASAYIANHMHYWHGAYLSKDDKKVSWDPENLMNLSHQVDL